MGPKHCAAGVVVLALASGAIAADELVLTNADGDVQVTLPADWTRRQAQAAPGEIEAAGPQRDAILFAAHKRKVDYAYTSLDDVAAEKIANLKASTRLADLTISPITHDRINGHPALHLVATTRIGNNKLTIFQTYVELEASWDYVTLSAPPTRAEALRPVFDAAVRSMKEITPATRPAK